MRKVLHVLLVSLCILAVMLVPLTSRAAQPDQKLHQKCLYPVVQVTPYNKLSGGSGVIVRSTKVEDGVWHNIFISCAHVAEASSDPYVVRVYHYDNWSSLKGNTTYNCKFYATDEKRDLAIGVFVTEEEMPVAEIDFATSLYIGTEVMRIGCGLGDEPRLDYGKVTSVRTVLPASLKGTIRTSVHTLPGDSGSPLYHNYKVVGITQAIRLSRGIPVFGTSYFVPLERLKVWDEETDGALSFAWRNKRLPRMPFYQLNLEQYEVEKGK